MAAKACNSSGTALVVASQRLKETKENVSQQLKAAEDRVKSLCRKRTDLSSRLSMECDSVEQQIHLLKQMLDEKKIDCVKQLKMKRSEELDSLSANIEQIEMVISKTVQVIDVANDLENELNQERFFAAYSSINNSLEERFVDLLLTMDTQMSDGMVNEYSIDLSKVAEELRAVGVRASEKGGAAVPESELVSENTSVCVREVISPISQQEGEDATVSHNGADENKEEMQAVSAPGGRAAQIESLQLTVGTSLSVYVTGVRSPQDFTVQPLGTDLISMMEAIGDHYSNSSQDFTNPPEVGNYCCAQFSEDGCWYRARILQVEENSQQVRVSYVDYGNEEVLPLGELQPLDLQFYTLPCQAVQCCLQNVLPFSPATGAWPGQVCDWFASLLLGRTVQVVISGCSADRLLLEILLPRDQLEKFILPKVRELCASAGDVPLSSFMDSAGLSRKSLDVDCANISGLPPLLVQLNAGREFTCLMSHVADQLHFYVHPVQEDLANTLSLINDVLCDHYSVDQHRQQLPREDVKCGQICCMYSSELRHWCRGVVTSLKTELADGVLTCLIFHLDYGLSEWMETSDLFVLIESLRGYSSQVLCCHFEEVAAECSAAVLLNPDIKSLRSDVYSCSIPRGHNLSECAQFMQRAAEEKQLFVVVKEKGLEGEAVVLVQELGCMLPVDLYDTTGEQDVHLNKELLDFAANVHSKKNGTASVASDENISARLQHWNPMEDDFLSKRNIYKIDDSDAGLALEGYKSTSRICRFYASREGCFEGKNCKFLHLEQELCNKQMEVAVVNSSSVLKLPGEGEWLVAIVTAVVSPTRFYIQLPLGCKSPLALHQSDREEADDDLEGDFFLMLEEMRDFYNKQVFSERDVIQPHTGEVVAVYDEKDGHWYRARVIDSNVGSITVFFVDYGNTSTILDENIRCLKPKFLDVPFQAVECFIPSLQIAPLYVASPVQAREIFTDLIHNKALVAQVVSVEANGSLGLELYSSAQDGTTDLNINKCLVERGVLTRQTLRKAAHIKDTTISMRPG